jgi:hypothetical protein
MRWPTVITITSCLLLATACDSNKKPLHRDFGKSVTQNMHVHIVKPRVANPNAAVPELEGTRAFRAIDRYNQGETEEVKSESTTASPSAGSGGK